MIGASCASGSASVASNGALGVVEQTAVIGRQPEMGIALGDRLKQRVKPQPPGRQPRR